VRATTPTSLNSVVRMHADELDITATLVRRLLAVQFPDWADLRIEAVEPRGTDNTLYRLGDDMVVRLPCRERTVKTLMKEREWLPRLAPHLPFDIPIPVAVGTPADGYPWTWSVYRWLQGENAIASPIADLRQAATDLARFLRDLQRIDASGGPRPGEDNFLRGAPLGTLDAAVRAAIVALRHEIDVDTVTAVREAALRAPEWERPPVWVHGDLDARNLLVRDARLSAVVDFGCLGVGDPACDVAVAWKVLSTETRNTFRSALSVDDATWARARGWVLYQALGALAYYTAETNQVLVTEARRWLADVIADHAST
jgi:aminoglycoside phosphotransferase (APT) family kinase protein